MPRTASEKKEDRNTELAAERARIVDSAERPQPVTPDEGGRDSWATLVARHGGSPFVGKAFLTRAASSQAGYPVLAEWPQDGSPAQWRRAAGVTALRVAYVLQVPEELVLVWEDGQAPNPDNWRGGIDLDDLSARRLYGAFRDYAEATGNK